MLLRSWTTWTPLAGAAAVALTWGGKPGTLVLVFGGLLLATSVVAAVQHAELIAHRAGEPYGSLVLAVAVTVIEVGLIVALMTAGGPAADTLARDTVFAAVMITLNGIVGLSVLVAALRDGQAEFNSEGAATALTSVATLATLTLVLPSFTTSRPGAEFAPAQLAFAAVASIGLTIPAIAIASIWLDGPLLLGLGETQIVLLTISALVGALTVLPGRATVQQGAVHLALALAFVFLAIRP